MKKILHNKKGETLVEVMAAILIFTLSSIILYTMITSASKVNAEAQDFDKAVYDQMLVTERGQTPAKKGTVKISYVKSGAKEEINSVPVDIFKTDAEDSMISYYKSK